MFTGVLLGGCVVEYSVDMGDAGSTTSDDDGCGANAEMCGEVCVDVLSDTNHCGGCGQACAADNVCDAGMCASECSGGRTQCGQLCVDLTSNLAHCGECGESCDADGACIEGNCQDSCAGGCDASNGEECVAGLCVCRTGLTDCEGKCVDLMADANNCGQCERGCDGDVCLDGECVSECGTLTQCDGACVDTMSNPLHCGDCDNVCDPGSTCTSGDCEEE